MDENEFETEVLDENSSVEDGISLLIRQLNQTLDYLKWVHSDENSIAASQSIENCIEVSQWIDERLQGVHFELDFDLTDRRFH